MSRSEYFLLYQQTFTKLLKERQLLRTNDNDYSQPSIQGGPRLKAFPKFTSIRGAPPIYKISSYEQKFLLQDL